MARGGIILEVASALGAPARYIARRFSSMVVCVDMDPRMHAAAAAVNRLEGVHRIVQPVLARTERLPLADGSCDGAWSQDAMCHMDKPAVLAEVARVLKPGAVFAFTDFIAERSITPGDLEMLKRLWAFPSLFTLPRYSAALTESGFEVLHAEDRTKAVLAQRTRGLPDDEAWWREFASRWGPAEAQARLEAGAAWQSLLEGGRAGYGMFIARRRT
jgi:sarcosine/dimethylglycine N-methyltransferase